MTEECKTSRMDKLAIRKTLNQAVILYKLKNSDILTTRFGEKIFSSICKILLITWQVFKRVIIICHRHKKGVDIKIYWQFKTENSVYK